jgi:hypothetical protein
MTRFLKGTTIAAMLLGSSVANSEPATYLSPNARAELASALHHYDNDCAPIGPDLGLAVRILITRTTTDRFRAANEKLDAEVRRMGVRGWCETYQPLINNMKRTGGDIDWR